MRTTLDIDDDVLMAVREIAAKEKRTAGKVLSEFTRRGLLAGDSTPSNPKRGMPYAMKNGIPILPSRGEVVSTGSIQRIMDEEGI
jgi:hypothetical protein